MGAGTVGLTRAESVELLIDRSIVFVFGLTLVAALFYAVAYGWTLNTGLAAYVEPIKGAAVILAEVGGAALVARFLFARQWGWALAAAFFWLFAFSYSLFLTVQSAATTLDTSAATRVAEANAYEDRQAAVKRAEEKVAAETAALAAARGLAAGSMPTIDGKPITSAAQAQAVIDNVRADRLYRYSKECTKTSGPQTRALCGRLAEAESALAAVSSRASVTGGVEKAEARLADAEAALAAARAAVGASGPPVISAEKPIVTVAAALMPWADKQSLGILFAVHAGLVLQVFLSMTALFVEKSADRVDQLMRKKAGAVAPPSTMRHVANDTSVVNLTPAIVERRVERMVERNDPFADALDRVARGYGHGQLRAAG